VESGKQALDYTFELVAIYALWQGVFCVAEKCNLVVKLAKALSKLNKFLYGNVTKQAQEYLALNMASNLIGVGNASTPSAIEAIKLMETSDNISRGGAMLFVVNACGLQLVPTTVIGLRATFGSQNPSKILLPTIVCTAFSLMLGIFLTNLAYPKKS
jgi:spore maturation protein A